MEPAKQLFATLNLLADQVRKIVPLFEFIGKIFQMIPAPIIEAFMAFAAMSTVMKVVASGPGQQLLETIGLNTDALGAMAGAARFVIPGIVAVGAAYKSNFMGFKDAVQPIVQFPNMIKQGFDLAKVQASQGTESLKGSFANMSEAMRTDMIEMQESSGSFAVAIGQQLYTLTSTALPQIDLFIGGLATIGPAIRDMFSGNMEVGLARLQGAVGGAVQGLTDALQSGVDFIGGIFDTLGNTVGAKAGEIGNKAAEGISAIIPKLLEGLAGLAQGIAGALTSALDSLKERIQGKGKEIGENLREAFSNLDPQAVGAGLMGMVAAIVSGVAEAFRSLIGIFTTIWGEIGSLIVEIAPPILDGLASMLNGVAERLPDMFIGLVEAGVGAIDDTIKEWARWLGMADEQLTTEGTSAIAEAGGNLVGALRNVLESVWSALGEAVEIWKTHWAEWAPVLGALWDRVRPYLERFVNFMLQLFGRLWAFLAPTLAKIATKIWTAICEWVGPRLKQLFLRVLMFFITFGMSELSIGGVKLGEAAYKIGGWIANKFKDGLNALNPVNLIRNWMNGNGAGAGGGGSIYGADYIAGAGGGGGPQIDFAPQIGSAVKAAGAKASDSLWAELRKLGGQLRDEFLGPGGENSPLPSAGELVAGGIEGGGTGKGPKEPKGGGGDKGEKQKEDPLQIAMQAIQNVASGIKAGLEAMKSVWTEFIGAPPDEMMAEVFASMQKVLDGAIVVAATINPTKAIQLKEGLDFANSSMGLLKNTVDTMNAVVKVRVPSQAQIEQVFAMATRVGELSQEMMGQFDLGAGASGDAAGLQSAVSKITLSKDFADSIGTWAGVLAQLADATTGIARARTDVDFAVLGTFFTDLMKMSLSVADSIGKTNSALVQSMTFSKTLGEGVLVWADVLAAMGDGLKAIQEAVIPADLTNVEGLVQQVADMGNKMTTDFKTLHGDQFLLAAEDLKLVADGVTAWVEPLTNTAELMDKLSDVRADVSMGAVAAWLDDLIVVAQEATAKFAGPEILRVTDDLKAVAEGIGAWTEPLTGAAEAAEAISKVAPSMVRVEGFGELLGKIEDIIFEVSGDRIKVLGDRAVIATQLTADLAESVGKWLEVFTDLGKAMESVQVLARIKSTQGTLRGLEEARTMLDAIGAIVYHFQSMLQGGAATMLKNTQDWEDMQVLAETFEKWIEPLTKLASALTEVNKLRELDDIDKIMAGAVGVMQTIATQSWTLMAESINLPGFQEFQNRSQAVASTFEAWIGVFSSMGEFTMALRKTRAEQLNRTDVLQQMVSVMETMGSLLWGTAEEPGIVQAVSRGADAQALQDLSQAVASTVGVWIDVFAGVARISREVPVYRDSTAILPAIEGFMEILVGLSDSVTEALKRLHPGDPGGAADLMGNVASMLGGWASALNSISETSRKIITFVQPTAGEWRKITTSMMDLWNNFKGFATRLVPDLVEWSLETEPRMAEWAKAVSSISSVVQSVLGLNTYSFVMPIQQEWDRVITAFNDLWRQFHLMAEQLMPSLVVDAQEVAAKSKAFSEHLKDLTDVVASIQKLVVLPEETAYLSKEALGILRENISMLMEEFEGMARDWAGQYRVPDAVADNIKSWSETVKVVLDAISRAFEITQALSGELVPKLPRQGTLAMIKRTITTTLQMFQDLYAEFDPHRNDQAARPAGFSVWDMVALPLGMTDPQRTALEKDQLLGQLKGFSDALGSVINATNGIMSMLVNYADTGHKLFNLSQTAKNILMQGIRDVVDLFASMADEYDQGTLESRKLIGRVAEFASNVNTIVAPIKTIIEVLTAVDEFLWETLTIESAGSKAIGGALGAGAKDPARRRNPDAVTASGKWRFRRMYDITRESIKRVLATAKMFLDEVSQLMKDMRTEFENWDPEGEFEKFQADVAGFIEMAASAAGMVKSVSEAIQSLIDSSLTVSILGSNSGMGKQLASDWWIGVRERWMNEQAKQLKESFKRQLRIIVDAIKEAFKEFDAEGGMPDPMMLQRIADMTQAITSVANSITRLMEMPTIDMAKVTALVKASQELAKVELPPWAFGTGVGVNTKIIEDLVAMLQIIMDLDVDPFVRNVEVIIDALNRLFSALNGGTGGDYEIKIGGSTGEFEAALAPVLQEAIVAAARQTADVFAGQVAILIGGEGGPPTPKKPGDSGTLGPGSGTPILGAGSGRQIGSPVVDVERLVTTLVGSFRDVIRSDFEQAIIKASTVVGAGSGHHIGAPKAPGDEGIQGPGSGHHIGAPVVDVERLVTTLVGSFRDVIRSDFEQAIIKASTVVGAGSGRQIGAPKAPGEDATQGPGSGHPIGAPVGEYLEKVLSASVAEIALDLPGAITQAISTTPGLEGLMPVTITVEADVDVAVEVQPPDLTANILFPNSALEIIAALVKQDPTPAQISTSSIVGSRTKRP